ncbi:MAG: BACON domain-containing protein, partial [Actinomycetia bacterium]|nr:BACON domain-containing protein [Actinomycetes bacterium]
MTALSATQASLTVTLSGSGRMTPVISGPTVIDVPATGAGARGLSPVSATFTATGVTSVRAIALDSWAGASASVSPGSLRLSLDVAPNLTASPRSTQVAVSAPGMQEPVFVMLRQAAGGSNPISVSLPSWSAPGAGGTQPVQVNTSGVWEVSTPDWITASPGFGSGGTQVTLKAAPNTSGADRSATVLFVAGGRWASVVVSQSAQVAAGDDCGNTPSTACSWPDLGVPVSGRIETLGDTDWFRIVVPVPGQWSFTYTRPAVDPIASSVGTVYWDQKNGRPPASIASDFYSAGDSQFRVKANLQAGETYYLEVSSSRAALVTGNYMVTAIPPGGSVPPSLSASSWNPAAAGGSTSVQVWASGDWSVTWPLWVTASRSSGSGNGSVDLTASANTGTAARSWTATFTSGALSATFTITQAAGVVPQLTLSQTTWSAPAGGGDVPVDVTSNVAWQVTTTAGVSVSQSSGSGNGRVTVTASPNPGSASRTMTVTFTGGGMTARLDISQVGQVASLSLSASSWG